MFTHFVKQLQPEHRPDFKLCKLIINFPTYALKPANYIPDVIQLKIIQKVLSTVLKEALDDNELEFLQDRWLTINVTEVPYVFHISIGQDGELIIAKKIPQEPDVIFAGSSQSMLQLMSRNIDPDTLFFQRKLLVTGDTELGLEIKNFLDDMSLERLPKFVQQALQQYNTLVTQSN